MLLQWLYSIPARNPNWAGTDKLIGGLQAQRWYYHGYLYRPGVCLCVCGHVAIFLTACLCVRGSSYVSARMHVLCVYIKREGVVTESMVQIKKGWGWGGGMCEGVMTRKPRVPKATCCSLALGVGGLVSSCVVPEHLHSVCTGNSDYFDDLLAC